MQFLKHLKNAAGWKTNERLVIFESDDWGGDRLPTVSAYEKLRAMGYLDSGKWSADSLETGDDICRLNEVLEAAKDSNGRPAVLSMFFNVANPDFKEIKARDYTQYIPLPLDKYLLGRITTENNLALLKEGERAGVFSFAYHGREHIATELWLKTLRGGDQALRFAFDLGVVAVKCSNLPKGMQGFRPAFYKSSSIETLEADLKDGLQHFQRIFSSHPKLFCPTNGLWHQRLDPTLEQIGIKAMVSDWIPLRQTKSGDLKRSVIERQWVKRNGILRWPRNVMFEPEFGYFEDHALAAIQNAFKWSTPAIINTHRLNYSSAIVPDRAKKNTHRLANLLKQITKIWPEVEFISSSELLARIEQSRPQ